MSHTISSLTLMLQRGAPVNPRGPLRDPQLVYSVIPLSAPNNACGGSLEKPNSEASNSVCTGLIDET